MVKLLFIYIVILFVILGLIFVIPDLIGNLVPTKAVRPGQAKRQSENFIGTHQPGQGLMDNIGID